MLAERGRTRNPHDTRRTPGGSSSGSAAAVGAATIPGAIGTHARGSTIRPASFCGTYALKPTYGAINRQGVFSAADSMDHIGTFAGSLDDMWIIARHMAAIAGGDPGHPGLYGAATPPEPLKPARLIRLDTAGWAQTDEASKAGFERIIAGLAAAGVTIHARRDDPTIDTFEDYLAEMPELWRSLYRFEMRWPLLQYRDRYPDQIPPRLLRGLEEGAGLTQAEYRDALVRRAYVRACIANSPTGSTDSSRYHPPDPARSDPTRAVRFSTSRHRCSARRRFRFRCLASKTRRSAYSCLVSLTATRHSRRVPNGSQK